MKKTSNCVPLRPRLASAAMISHIEAMPYHDPTGDLLAFRQFCRIADKIEADPAVLEIPLANIRRWLGDGHWAKRELGQWRRWIEDAQSSPEGLGFLLALLRDDSEESRDWKGFSPFPGILTKAERQEGLCISRH